MRLFNLCGSYIQINIAHCESLHCGKQMESEYAFNDFIDKIFERCQMQKVGFTYYHSHYHFCCRKFNLLNIFDT